LAQCQLVMAMMAWEAFSTFLLCLVLQVSAQITVLTPANLANSLPGGRGAIKGSTSTFGAPYYGEAILGRVIWEESNGKAHCTDQDYDVALPDAGIAGYINIVMVRRGVCSVAQKVRVAEAKGAHAVIIVDREDSMFTADDMDSIIVKGDGYSDAIKIPSILIPKLEGGQLIDAAKKVDDIVVELRWDIPTNHVVEIDMWISSASEASQEFLKEFAPKRKILNEVVTFRPHYHVFSLAEDDPSIYHDLCTDTTGKFCTEDPDGPGEVTGRDVLEEDVRQLCIHEQSKVVRAALDDFRKERGTVVYAEKFWDYIVRFASDCTLDATNENDRFGSKCAESTMNKVGIDTDLVRQCVLRTSSEKLMQQSQDTAWSPDAIRINGWRYKGMLHADLVTNVVCSGFVTKPKECLALEVKRNPVLILEKEGITVLNFFLGIAVVVAVLTCGLCLYRRVTVRTMYSNIREEVMLEVQSQMGNYAKMNGEA